MSSHYVSLYRSDRGRLLFSLGGRESYVKGNFFRQRDVFFPSFTESYAQSFAMSLVHANSMI
jgi:hypothetical protein